MCRGESPDATDGLGAVPTPIDPKVTGLSAYLSSFRLRELDSKDCFSQYKANVFKKILEEFHRILVVLVTVLLGIYIVNVQLVSLLYNLKSFGLLLL